MKATTDTIIELIKSETDAKIDYSNIKNNIPLSDQGMDSLDHLTLFLSIDEELGVTIEDEVIEQLKTIDNIVDFINKQ